MVQGIEVDRRFLTNPHNSSTKSVLIRRRAVLISPERTPAYVFNKTSGEWPSHFAAVAIGTPCRSQSVAHACRYRGLGDE